MSDIRDSVYTDPEKLRILYRNPRNPLKAVEDVQTNGAGDGGGEQPIFTFNPNQDLPQPHFCPYVYQFIPVLLIPRFDRREKGEKQIDYKMAGDLQPFVDYAYNPITKKFNKIIKAEIIPNQYLYRFRTKGGYETIGTASHPIIQDLRDQNGKRIIDFQPSESVLCWDSENLIYELSDDSTMHSLDSAVHITLETEHIYAAGSGNGKLQFILCHNKASNDDQSQIDEILV